jgi:hypothetical protein
LYPATIVGIPPMEDFYIGGASVKLFLPIFKMNFYRDRGHRAAGGRRVPQPMAGARRSRRFTAVSPGTSEQFKTALSAHVEAA